MSTARSGSRSQTGGSRRVPGIPPPRLFSAELLSRRLTGEPEFRPLSGTVLLRLPDPEQAAPPVGSVAEVEGTLELPTHQAVRRVDGKLQIETGGMDFASYLAGRGASRSLRAEQIQMKEPPSGFDAGCAASATRCWSGCCRKFPPIRCAASPPRSFSAFPAGWTPVRGARSSTPGPCISSRSAACMWRFWPGCCCGDCGYSRFGSAIRCWRGWCCSM